MIYHEAATHIVSSGSGTAVDQRTRLNESETLVAYLRIWRSRPRSC